MTKIHQWKCFVFAVDITTQACSQDFSWGEGGGQINNVRMIGYTSCEDITSG